VTYGGGTDWSRIAEVPGLVARLYAVVDELELIAPGRHFTPDGHLVGSIGEVLAAYAFDLDLNVASTAGYDALLGDTKVEIKATQRSSFGISAGDAVADVLLALKLERHRPPQLVYNGPAAKAWEIAGPPQKNGQRALGLAKLRALDATLGASERLRVVRPLEEVAWPAGHRQPAE